MRALYCAKKGKEFPMLPAGLDASPDLTAIEFDVKKFKAPWFVRDRAKLVVE